MRLQNIHATHCDISSGLCSMYYVQKACEKIHDKDEAKKQKP